MINAVSYDFENIRIDLGPAGEVTGITNISYELTVDTEKEYGASREAFDATEGVHNVEDVTITMKEFALRNLIEKIGGGFMTKAARFDISVTYAHEGEPTVTDVLQRCRIIGISADHSQGPEGLEKELTLQCMKIIYGGFDPAVA
jgi:hypothetical protein